MECNTTGGDFSSSHDHSHVETTPETATGGSNLMPDVQEEEGENDDNIMHKKTLLEGEDYILIYHSL